MSVNIKTSSGLVQVAGNTILLDGTCSEIQSGTITVPANTANGDWSTTVTMPTAMTDTDYIVILNILPVDGTLYTANANYRAKTTTSFIVHCETENIPLAQTIEWYAFRLVELEGYNAIYNKMTNIDSTPTENSTNLVTSGGVYDAIKNASSVFVGTAAEWAAETSKTDFNVALITDSGTINAVDDTTGDTEVVANKHLVFTGALSEWEALSVAERKAFDEALISNDMDTGEVVNGVIDGDMRAVTSNAVYDAITETRTTYTVASWGTNLNVGLGDSYYYFPKAKRIFFPNFGGAQAAGVNLQGDQLLCTLNIPNDFVIPGYGINIPAVLRNSSSGTLVPTMVNLAPDKTLRLQCPSDGLYNEFRILGASIFSGNV